MEWGIAITAFYLVGMLVLVMARLSYDERMPRPEEYEGPELPEEVPELKKAA